MKTLSQKRNDWVKPFPLLAFALLLCLSSSQSLMAQHKLQESIDSKRVVSTSMTVEASGKLQTASGEGSAISLPLEMKAQTNFNSRKLPSAGRDARAYRELRNYQLGVVNISAGKEKNKVELPANLKKAVAEGNRQGISIYAPELILTRNIADLLNTPADPLAILPFLPSEEVKLGDEWNPESWAVSMLTSVEATLESKMTCKLTAVERDIARVDFEGSVKGAISGAETEITAKGFYLFDLKQKLLSYIDMTQTEKRSVGTVSPGMDVTARAIVKRSVASSDSILSDEAMEAIPLDPGPKVELLTFQSGSWKIRFFHDRDWFIFQEVPQVVVLRLVDQGSLIAQCNASLINTMPAGEHTSQEKFQKDIRASLGESLTQIVKAEQIKLKDNDKRYIYRVIAEGKVKETEMLWYYYLTADASGRQVSFVFAVEPRLVDKMNDRDLGIVTSLQFLDSK